MLSCRFQYTYRWPSIYKGLLGDDPVQQRVAIDWLVTRDRELEDHMKHYDAGKVAFHLHYPFEWPQIASALGRAEAVDWLEANDRTLEDTLNRPLCCTSGCKFRYPWRWTSLMQDLLSDDPTKVMIAVAQLDDRDRALEGHFYYRDCGPCVGCA